MILQVSSYTPTANVLSQRVSDENDGREIFEPNWEIFSSSNYCWLVVEPTHLKNISQNGNLPQIGVKFPKIFETTT